MSLSVDSDPSEDGDDGDETRGNNRDFSRFDTSNATRNNARDDLLIGQKEISHLKSLGTPPNVSAKMSGSMFCEQTRSTEEQLKADERLRYHVELEKRREQVWTRKYRNIGPAEFEKINWEENLEGKGFQLAKAEPLGKTKYSDTYKCNIKPGSQAVNMIEAVLKEIKALEDESSYKLAFASKESLKVAPVLACRVVRIKSLYKPIISLYAKRNVAVWLSLKHRSLVVIYKMFVTNALDKYYIFVDFGDQGTLTKYMKANFANAGLPVDRASVFALDVLHGLHFLHSNGISHRKLKSDNIFVCQSGKQLKIAGLEYFQEICDVDHNGERSQCWMQHEHNGFSAIEAIANDPHSPFLEDIFGFGALFYFLLADHPPFEACKLLKDSSHNCREHRSSFRRNITAQSWTKRDSYKQKENDQIKGLMMATFNLNVFGRPSTEELLNMDLFKAIVKRPRSVSK